MKVMRLFSAALIAAFAFQGQPASARPFCGLLLDTVQRVFKNTSKRHVLPPTVKPSLEELERRDTPGQAVAVYLQFSDLLGSPYPGLPVTATSPITGQVFPVGITNDQGVVSGVFYDPDIGTQHSYEQSDTETEFLPYQPGGSIKISSGEYLVTTEKTVTTTDIPQSYAIVLGAFFLHDKYLGSFSRLL